MTTDDILKWISNRKVKAWQEMQDNITNDEKWNRAKGAYDILEQLYLELLNMENPNNKAGK